MLLALVPALHGGDRAAVESCAKARAEIKRGRWLAAESHYRTALAACGGCTVEEKLVLRSELATALVHGGFAEAAVAEWRRSMAEIDAAPELRAIAESGLGVALFATGRRIEAERVWRKACGSLDGFALAQASCRFNLAVARMDRENVWGELEELLPVVLDVEGAIYRATALLQTSRAALRAGEIGRARTLAERAETVVRSELDGEHPVMGSVYAIRAEIAEASGLGREAKEWRKKLARPRGEGWKAGSVSVEELRRKPL